MEIQPELRRVSDSILEGVDRLRALEQEKRTLPVGSPRFLDIAQEVEELAREILRKSELEEHLGQRNAERQARGPGSVEHRTIDETPPPRDRGLVLEEWAAAERRVAGMDPDSPGAEEARAEARRLRDEWRSISGGPSSE
jgi:hypothetical protein